MPALVAGIHVFAALRLGTDVDGRTGVGHVPGLNTKSGHDGRAELPSI
jgi:hypothetical protein